MNKYFFSFPKAYRDNTLWAITKEGHLIKRQTQLLKIKNTTQNFPKTLVRLNSLNTDDWEVID